ncbi:5'-nucleotidase domain-containing protein 4 [Tanacetum coccineum]
MYNSFGYEEKLFYHFKIPCKGLDIRLRLLSSDSDIADMLQYVYKHKIMDVYVEHDKLVVDPSLNVDEAGPSNVLGHENDKGQNEVGVDEGNYDEAENKDIGDGEDYEADNKSESEKGEAEDEGQNEEEDEAEDLGEREEEDEGYEEDKHIDDIVNEEHIVDELEVEVDDLEVLDFDSFKSDIDDDKDGSRRKGLRKLRKEAGNSTSTTSFYVEKEFPNRDVAKEMVRAHGVETRRNIMIVKNDKIRIRASKTKAFIVKAKAQSHLKGDAIVQYSLLRDYVQELKRCNPNNIVKIDVYGEKNHDSPTRMFRRIYVCLGALKEGFRASRRELLGLDGAFMRGQYSVQLLTTVGVDENNGIYPVAYGIVESESSYSWTLLLTFLGDDLDLFTNSNFTFISDRQKGLVSAIAKVFPVAEHEYCLLDARDSPIISCLEYVREYLMKRIVIVQKAIERCEGPLTLAVTSIFKAIKEKSVQYTIDWNGAELCQVKGPYGDQCVVNLQQRVCSCRKWEVSGIPCKHVVACIHDMADNGIDSGKARRTYKGQSPASMLRSGGKKQATNSRTQAGVTAAGSQAASQVGQQTQAVGGSHAPAVTVSPMRRTKKSASRLAPIKNTT